jgi:hypothetical protein
MAITGVHKATVPSHHRSDDSRMWYSVLSLGVEGGGMLKGPRRHAWYLEVVLALVVVVVAY